METSTQTICATRDSGCAEITIYPVSGARRSLMWFKVTKGNRVFKNCNKAAMEVLRRDDTTVIDWGRDTLLIPLTKETANLVGWSAPVLIEVARVEWFSIRWPIEPPPGKKWGQHISDTHR